MATGTEAAGAYSTPRRESRVPMEVGVQISGHVRLPGVETTFTQNVSSSGARVLSMRRWQPNDRLWLSMLTGAFRSLARVAYCEPQRESGFAIGLEFLEPDGSWVIANAGRSMEAQLQ
jgi:PilZ domain-containing protein